MFRSSTFARPTDGVKINCQIRYVTTSGTTSGTTKITRYQYCQRLLIKWKTNSAASSGVVMMIKTRATVKINITRILSRIMLSENMRLKLSRPTQRGSLKPSQLNSDSRMAVNAGKYMKASKKANVGTRNR
jgi:hypothetical protein